MFHAQPAASADGSEDHQRGTSLRSLLVVPYGAPSHRTGGGQRSLLILQALCGLGPTTLVYDSETQAIPDATHLPAGAECDVAYFGKNGTAKKQIEPKALRRTLVKLDRIANRFLPGWYYRKRSEFAEGLDRVIAEKKPDLVVFRYVDGLMLTDLRSTDGLAIIVDIDDRPDAKLIVPFRLKFGAFLTEWLYAPYVRTSLMRRAKRCLSQAQLLLFAKPADVLDVAGPRSSVLSNVPFVEPTLVAENPGPRLLFVGAQTYAPNKNGMVWFLENCWPEIAAQNSAARLRVVGSGNWPEFGLAYQHLDRVDFVGFADDLNAEYAQATASICPIFEGAGTQIKVIESCAFGRPVVTSAFSADGFGKEIADHLIVAQDKNSFVAGCLTLLRDPQQALRIGKTLRGIQQRQFSRASFINKLRSEILSLTARPTAEPFMEVSQ